MFGQFGQPGQTAIVNTNEAELLWGGDLSRIPVLRLSKQSSTTLADAANSPTTVVRAGMLLGLLTSNGQSVQWDATATDGSQNLAGVLPVELLAIDQFGVAVNRVHPMIVSAPLKASALKVKGAALVGHADEYIARRSLWAMGCRLDDDPAGIKAGMFPRYVTKATNYTVVAADNGTTFVAITADATFTLPTIAPGLSFEFLRASDHELAVASAAGDDMLVGGDDAADSITFTTAGQQVGARVKVTGAYVNGTLKWITEIPPTPYGTGLATLAFALAT